MEMQLRQPHVEIGDKLYFPTRKFVVPCVVVDVDYVLQGPNGESGWWYRFQNGTETCFISGGGTFPKEDLVGFKVVNQFVWVDEPVGHALQINSEVFTDLNDALKQVLYTRNKRPKVMLKKYRRTIQNFIAKTQDKHPNFEKLPSKKIYVKK